MPPLIGFVKLRDLTRIAPFVKLRLLRLLDIFFRYFIVVHPLV